MVVPVCILSAITSDLLLVYFLPHIVKGQGCKNGSSPVCVLLCIMSDLLFVCFLLHIVQGKGYLQELPCVCVPSCIIIVLLFVYLLLHTTSYKNGSSPVCVLSLSYVTSCSCISCYT